MADQVAIARFDHLRAYLMTRHRVGDVRGGITLPPTDTLPPAESRTRGMMISPGPDADSLIVRGLRGTVAVVRAGTELPGTPDIVVIAGQGEMLGQAATRLRTMPGGGRVHMLPLPSTDVLVDQTVRAAVSAAEAYASARVTDQLIDIGVALNAERDPARVLELILQHARSITSADAGSIYLVEDEGRTLRFRTAHNDTVKADLSQFTMPVTPQSIVGAAVITKQTILIRDLYDPGGSMAQGRTFSHDRSFDERFGYQTRSMITTPMISPEGDVLAVIQLINKKRGPDPLTQPRDFTRRVRPFSEEDERLVSSLASQAAVALESARLYAEIQDLFEGFVRASVHAIEQRDPTTSGHSQRVADFTVALAQAADRTDAPRFTAVSFTREELREIEYAGLLHDFGKVGVREEVLVKAKKLYPHQLELVMARFDHVRTSLQLELLQAQVEALRAGHELPGDMQARIGGKLTQLDSMLQVVLEANEPSVLPKEASAHLQQVATEQYRDAAGHTQPLLRPVELGALLVTRGSLTADERREIQSHVTHTYNFLVRIPWGSSLRQVPEIAGKHHEYLDGSGYPESVGSAEIPLQAKMMTVSDIFDALTASDRPYKKAVPVPRALDILHDEVGRGKVDGDLLELFIGAKVFEMIHAREGAR